MATFATTGPPDSVSRCHPLYFFLNICSSSKITSQTTRDSERQAFVCVVVVNAKNEWRSLVKSENGVQQVHEACTTIRRGNSHGPQRPSLGAFDGRASCP